MIKKFSPSINEDVKLKLKTEDPVFHAVVESVDNAEANTIVLKLEQSPKINTNKFKGSVIVNYHGIDFYVEMVAIDDKKITIRSNRAGAREYFRIDDVIPMVVIKMDKNNTARRSKILTGYHSDMPAVFKDESSTSTDDNPHSLVLKKLGEIDAKISLVLERLYLESEGLFKAEDYHVTISGSGLSFICQNRYDVGDVLGLKLLLSTYPTVAVHTYGEIISVINQNTGQYKIGTRFIDIDEDVRSELIQFTMRREREKRMLG